MFTRCWSEVVILLCALALDAAALTPDPSPPPGGATPITGGTVFQIRLRQTVSSFGSKRATPISAIVIAPVESGGRTVLPMDAELRGTLRDVRRVGLGLARETAYRNALAATGLLEQVV